MEKACVHIYCGNGKGKTTSAVGLLTRAAGAEKKCLLAQFLKETPTSEIRSLEKLGVETMRAQCDIKKFIFKMTEEEKAEYRKAQQELFRKVAAAVASGEYDLIAMDEVLDAVAVGFVTEEELAELLKNKGSAEIVMTGRKPTECIAALADYHSCIDPVKHPYKEGLPARKGIEF